MRIRVLIPVILMAGSEAFPQNGPGPEARGPQPLYRVTIVSRTTKAINYGYLSAPTRIGFQGTPVAPSATGHATVEPGRGATLLNLRFDRVPPANRFGAQFLTYVVWAISPDGRAQNVGEIILDGDEKGKLSTSTPLQTFALIVTAEPYYAVSQPSEVVVLENVVTRDTVGKVTEVNATYELLPRKPYTYHAGQQPASAGQAVDARQYESIHALYQALNAIQIAQSQGADRHAPQQIGRARQLYEKARGFPVHLSKEIVSMAREATQIAEDSRAIAARRAQAETTATSPPENKVEPVTERTRPAEPVNPTPNPPQAATPLPPVEDKRTRTEAAQQPPSESRAPVEVDHNQFLRDHPDAAGNRRRLVAALPRNFEILDTSRGVMITIPEHGASTAPTQAYFSAVAAAMRTFRGLHVEVEAHDDTSGSLAATEREAGQARQSLIRGGVPPEIIIARGYGNTRPRASNATPTGRAINRRIEIIIAGDAIGRMPAWDRTYSLQPLRPQRVVR